MTTLAPADLDRAAARRPALTPRERRDFDRLTVGYERTAPAAPASRRLVTRTVDELVAEALAPLSQHGTRPPVDVRLPGRLAAVLPDWAHRHRTDITHPPSTQLYVAVTILREWGWQARPHHLRDRRGRRCICGALCTAVALGVGTMDSAETAAWHVLSELRDRGWKHLIGDWNQQSGRTAQQAIDVTEAAYRRALAAGS